jgi:hypothetical protein
LFGARAALVETGNQLKTYLHFTVAVIVIAFASAMTFAVIQNVISQILNRDEPYYEDIIIRLKRLKVFEGESACDKRDG